MKFKAIIILAMGVMTFAACSSDQKGRDGDSTLTDSSRTDTTGINGTGSGTSGATNSTNVDTGMRNTTDTTSKDTIPPIR